MAYRLISVDTHANEPEGLYRDGVPAKFRDRVPHIETVDGRSAIVVDGVRQITMDRTLNDLPETAWQELRRGEGSWEPAKRIAAQDRDGVAAEITEASDGFFSLMAPDPDLQMAMARVWNDWAVKTYKPYWDRLRPCALLPVLNLAESVEEAKRVADLGYTCVFMPPFVTKAYHHRDYDPLWEVIQERNLTMNMHMRTGVRPNPPFWTGRVFTYVDSCMDVVPAATSFCAGGVFERYPGLHFVMQEAGAGWISWLNYTMDGIQSAYPNLTQKLELKPSDYFRRQGHAAVMMDTAAMLLVKDIGADSLLWANDYPHSEGTWPESQRLVDRQVVEGGLSTAEIEKFTHRNAEKLYGFAAA